LIQRGSLGGCEDGRRVEKKGAANQPLKPRPGVQSKGGSRESSPNVCEKGRGQKSEEHKKKVSLNQSCRSCSRFTKWKSSYQSHILIRGARGKRGREFDLFDQATPPRERAEKSGRWIYWMREKGGGTAWGWKGAAFRIDAPAAKIAGSRTKKQNEALKKAGGDVEKGRTSFWKLSQSSATPSSWRHGSTSKVKKGDEPERANREREQGRHTTGEKPSRDWSHSWTLCKPRTQYQEKDWEPVRLRSSQGGERNILGRKIDGGGVKDATSGLQNLDHAQRKTTSAKDIQ